MKISQTKSKAFGIIEVLVASVIIMVILFALTAAGKSSLKGSILAQERAQALFLAQEGIEGVRQIRDTYWIDSGTDAKKWDYLLCLAGTGDVCGSAEDSNHKYFFGFDATTKNPVLAREQDGIDTVNYRDIVIDNVTFVRTIELSNVGDLLPSSDSENATGKDENAITVTVKVVWDGSSAPIEIKEVLTNWKPNY